MESRPAFINAHLLPRLAALMAFDISLQLYTVRDALKDDFIGGLEKVAEMGYSFVEFAGFGGHPASEIAKALENFGLAASGAHVPLSILEDPKPVVEELRAIGCDEATLPCLPESMRDPWSAAAKKIDDCALRMQDEGINLGYHNHAFEFESGGYEALVEHAPNTHFQLDVYWAAHAGEDPIKWIERLSGRMRSMHCKDMGDDGKDIELGDGVLGWDAILKAAAAAGVKTLVVEMDNPRLEPMESARQSLRGIERFI